jgi:prepilin-type processing-associated H-X9-DG protein
VKYADGYHSLWDDPPSAKSDRPSDRILMSERGLFGWDGPDGSDYQAPNTNDNHPMGVNALFFDGHVKTIVYGRKWTLLPATGWPPQDAPH